MAEVSQAEFESSPDYLKQQVVVAAVAAAALGRDGLCFPFVALSYSWMIAFSAFSLVAMFSLVAILSPHFPLRSGL